MQISCDVARAGDRVRVIAREQIAPGELIQDGLDDIAFEGKPRALLHIGPIGGFKREGIDPANLLRPLVVWIEIGFTKRPAAERYPVAFFEID